MCYIQVLLYFFDLTFVDYNFFNNIAFILAYRKYPAAEGMSLIHI